MTIEQRPLSATSGAARMPTHAPAVVLEVYGDPIPQGSMKPVTRKGQSYTQLVSDNPALKPWRERVRHVAMQTQAAASIKPWTPISGPVVIAAEFYVAKPKRAPKRRRIMPDTKPDLDKLTRAICDALSAAGTYEDDARITDLFPRVRYAEPDPALAHPWELVVPGVRIAVWSVDPDWSDADTPLVPFDSATFLTDLQMQRSTS